MGKAVFKSAAYCLNRGIPTSVFFPDEDHLGEIAYAKSICARCYAREECLEVAQINREEFGIFGGLTPSERLTLRRQEAMRSYYERHNIPHGQSHLPYESPSSQVHISFCRTHTQQALSLEFARKLASHVNGIAISKLQSPAEFPSDPNQRLLFGRLLAEYEKTRKQFDPPEVFEVQSRLTGGPWLRQSFQGPISWLSRQTV